MNNNSKSTFNLNRDNMQQYSIPTTAEIEKIVYNELLRKGWTVSLQDTFPSAKAGDLLAYETFTSNGTRQRMIPDVTLRDADGNVIGFVEILGICIKYFNLLMCNKSSLLLSITSHQ